VAQTESTFVKNSLKVFGCYLITFLNWTPIFHWVADQRINIIKTLVKRDWSMSSNFINHCTLNSKHDWEHLSVSEGLNKHTPPITI
jgi:hypothetical protein